MLTPDEECNECYCSNDESRNNLCRLPWVFASTPADTKEEESYAHNEQEDSEKVNLHDKLFSGLDRVKLLEGGRVVRDGQKHKCKTLQYDTEIIAPSPGGDLEEIVCCKISHKMAMGKYAKILHRYAPKKANGTTGISVTKYQ